MTISAEIDEIADRLAKLARRDRIARIKAGALVYDRTVFLRPVQHLPGNAHLRYPSRYDRVSRLCDAHDYTEDGSRALIRAYAALRRHIRDNPPTPRSLGGYDIEDDRLCEAIAGEGRAIKARRLLTAQQSMHDSIFGPFLGRQAAE